MSLLVPEFTGTEFTGTEFTGTGGYWYRSTLYLLSFRTASAVRNLLSRDFPQPAKHRRCQKSQSDSKTVIPAQGVPSHCNSGTPPPATSTFNSVLDTAGCGAIISVGKQRSVPDVWQP